MGLRNVHLEMELTLQKNKTPSEEENSTEGNEGPACTMRRQVSSSITSLGMWQRNIFFPVKETVLHHKQLFKILALLLLVFLVFGFGWTWRSVPTQTSTEVQSSVSVEKGLQELREFGYEDRQVLKLQKEDGAELTMGPEALEKGQASPGLQLHVRVHNVQVNILKRDGQTGLSVTIDTSPVRKDGADLIEMNNPGLTLETGPGVPP